MMMILRVKHPFTAHLPQGESHHAEIDARMMISSTEVSYTLVTDSGDQIPGSRILDWSLVTKAGSHVSLATGSKTLVRNLRELFRVGLVTGEALDCLLDVYVKDAKQRDRIRASLRAGGTEDIEPDVTRSSMTVGGELGRKPS